MWDLLGFCNIWGSTFTTDTHGRRDAFLEGQRNIGLRLFSEIMRACPEQYVQMMRDREDGRRDPDPIDRSNRDDDRNYDTAGRWIGDGELDDGE
jgi:hypothetical protein